MVDFGERKLFLKSSLDMIIRGEDVKRNVEDSAEILESILKDQDSIRFARAGAGAIDSVEGEHRVSRIGATGFYEVTRYNTKQERSFEFALPEGVYQDFPTGVNVRFYFSPQGRRESLQEMTASGRLGKIMETGYALGAMEMVGKVGSGKMTSEEMKEKMRKGQAAGALLKRGFDSVEGYHLERVEVERPFRKLPFIGHWRPQLNGPRIYFAQGEIKQVYP